MDATKIMFVIPTYIPDHIVEEKEAVERLGYRANLLGAREKNGFHKINDWFYNIENPDEFFEHKFKSLHTSGGVCMAFRAHVDTAFKQHKALRIYQRNHEDVFFCFGLVD